MLADPNWLLSSLAQSTAALVAIVGGLLVSRYVSLHAEQEAATRRVEDLSRRLAEAEKRYEASRLAQSEHIASRIVEDDDIYDYIEEASFRPVLDQVLVTASVQPEGLDREVLGQRIAAVTEEVQRALLQLNKDLPELTNPPLWDTYRRTVEYEIRFRDVWRWAYSRVSARKQRLARHMVEAFGVDDSRGVGDQPANDRTTRERFDGGSRMSDGDFLRQAVEDALTEVRLLQQERRIAVEAYDSARQPEGFGLALEVFTFLAVVGLALPLLIMTVGVTSLAAWLRIVLVVLFLAGVTLLLRFLFVYAHKLRRHTGEADRPLPDHLWGLLR